MIKLFHCVSARSFRPLWTLEELGLPYTLIMLPFPPRVLHKEYLAINPLGTVPALVDGAVFMTESAAMCQYLASREGFTNLSVQPGETAYASYLNWLHFGESTLTFPQSLVLRYGRLESPDRRQPQVVEDYRRWFLSRLRALDAPLENAPFLCGPQFTAADISVGYALMLAQYLGLHEKFSAGVAAYWLRLQQRAGFQQAMLVQARCAQEQGVPLTPAPLTGDPK